MVISYEIYLTSLEMATIVRCVLSYHDILIVGQLTESASPRFRFNMVVIMIYLFVLDDSLTSYRFSTRTAQLTKCCEPLQ